MCLSRSYEGDAFSHGYAIDPVSRQELDLDVDLALDAAAVAEIFKQEKVDFGSSVRDLGTLVGAGRENERHRALRRAIEFASRSACEECGVSEGDVLSDERQMAFARAVSQQLEPYLLHELLGSRFSEEELAAIWHR